MRSVTDGAFTWFGHYVNFASKLDAVSEGLRSLDLFGLVTKCIFFLLFLHHSSMSAAELGVLTLV